ncbi:MAG: MMPL family transporter [Nitriliruptoraceae bacterium]|nr:MMPL family transporter [Nitriliruptoraceae bacterium]
MRALIRLLAAVVTRAPVIVLLVTLAATVVFAGLSTTLEQASGQDGFAPESDAIDASERIGELFGEGSTTSVMQVVVDGAGASVLTADALRAVEQVRAAIADSDAAQAVSDDPAAPGVFSYLAPVEQQLAAEGLDAADLDDAEVADRYAAAVDAAGPELSFAADLLADGEDLGLLLVFVDASVDIDAQIGRESTIAAAIREVDPGADLSLQPFSFSLLFEDADDFLGEVATLFSLAFAIIIGVLLFVYWLTPRGRTRRFMAVRRTIADTSVTMLTIVLVVLWMNGIGALLQRAGILGPLTEVTQIVPILLVGLGVDYGIHLTSRYRDEIGGGASVQAAIRTSIGTVGVALVLATVTTAIGFLTNAVNPIPALADFGLLASVGIVAAFVLMLTFVPSLRLLLDRRAEAAGRLPTDGMGATRDRLFPALAARTSVLAERAPVPTLIVMGLLGGAGYLGLTNISTEFSFTDFLPEDAPVVETLEVIEDRFGGGFGESTQVLVEGDDLGTPAVFNALADASEQLAEVPDVLTVPGPAGPVASATSPVSVVGDLVVAAPGSDGPGGAVLEPLLAAGYDPASGRVAADADIDALYAVLDDVEDGASATVVHRDDAGRITAMLVELDTQAGDDRALALQDALLEGFAPVSAAGAAVTVTSNGIITEGIVNSLSDSQVRSLIITLVAATMVLSLSFWIENRRPMLGVLTMIPVALVVLWTFGLMYVSGIPFGPVTATLTGLAVGIGVPYTIHMARRFEEDRLRFDTVEEAIRESTRNTGGALAGSAVTTAAGFGVLITSSLVPFQQMGFVTAYAILLSLFGSLLVLPSLLVLWERWHRRRGTPAVERETVSVA